MTHTLKDKTIVITGASSGIGRQAALQLGAQGAKLILIARRQPLLAKVADEVRQAGGTVTYFSADLSTETGVDEVCQQIQSQHDKVDVLINNAGRSIRRSITDSMERYHDFDRCMAINYFGPVRMIRNLLPLILTSDAGQIINSSTWGTLLPATGFGPYNASKSALDSFSRTLRLELNHSNATVTQIHFPLVHTDMSGATESFRSLPGMTDQDAGKWILNAIEKRPVEIMDIKTRVSRWFYFFFPKLTERITLSLPFSLESSSEIKNS